MKPINIFGRKISVVAVLMIALLVGTASAMVVSEYFTVSQDVNVELPITVIGDTTTDLSLTGGENFEYAFTIVNGATVPISIDVTTIVEESTDNGNSWNDATGQGFTIVQDPTTLDSILGETSEIVTITVTVPTNVDGLYRVSTSVTPAA